MKENKAVSKRCVVLIITLLETDIYTPNSRKEGNACAHAHFVNGKFIGMHRFDNLHVILLQHLPTMFSLWKNGRGKRLLPDVSSECPGFSAKIYGAS